MNGERNEALGGGGFRSNYGSSMPHAGRKRPRHHLTRGHSPDEMEASGHAKLYVAQVPRTATEETIRPVFEEYGNIVEVVILRDKRSGQQQGSCFVKYSSTDEADRAIHALDNQYTFPGEMIPVNVKYADGERERLGVLSKLYVGGMNRDATKREVEEIFAPYGLIEDIYIVRDDLKQSRGCAFVKFSQRNMALEAIKALHGNFIMRGCDQPLIVRFADPKKPKIGEPRPEPPFGGPMGGRFPNNLYPTYQVSASSEQPASFQMSKQDHCAPSSVKQVNPPLDDPPPKFAQPIQQTKASQSFYESTQPSVSEMQKQMDLKESREDLHHQPLQINEQQSTPVECNAETANSCSSLTAEPPSSQRTDSLECDWSEHTCPDGFKYYYNCVSCESRWDKPEEFALYEQQLRNHQKMQNSGHLHKSSSPAPSHQEPHTQKHLFQQNFQLEQPSLAATEQDHGQLQSKASNVISPTCV